LSAASSFDTTVDFFTDADYPNDNDYQNASGTLTFVAGETQKTIVVKVKGDTLLEEDEVFLVKLTNPMNAEIGKGQGNGTIINDDTEGGTTVQFSQASFDVQEDLTAAIITVIRAGDTSGTTTVNYFTEDGTATQKSDYEIASGTLTS
jgi:chitinase